MQKSKHQIGINSNLTGILKGLFAGILCFVVSISIFSLLILKSEIQNFLFFILALSCSGISSFFSSLTTAASVKKSRLIFALISALILLITEFILLLCFNNASLSIKIYLIVPVMLFFGMLGGIIGANLKLK